VRHAEDLKELQALIEANSEYKIPIIAKIEKPEAVANIDKIIPYCDGLMVARGDLGVEIPLEEVPLAQKMIIKKTNALSKPVIIATQIMENMVENIHPSRAEVNDVANSVMDGADALMLSAETSVGKFPVEVIQTMERIISQVEDFEDIYYKHYQPIIENNPRYITDSVLHTACNLAKESNAKAIVAMTQSGYSAYKISSQRPRAKVYIFTNNRSILNTLNLLWGIEGFYYDKYISTDHTIEDIKYYLKKIGKVKEGDLIINTATTPLQDYGKTNMLKLSIV
jgi:pyruvate kinase